MGICIKGVEMPAEGVLCIDIFPDGRVAGHYDCTIEQAKAMPVPAHGRLIDADANLAVMMRVLDVPYTGHGTIDTAMLKACIKMFEEAPTIIEAEEAET